MDELDRNEWTLSSGPGGRFHRNTHIWAWLKDYCARTSAYSTIKELRQRIHKFHIYAYNTPSKVRRRVDARAYFKVA